MAVIVGADSARHLIAISAFLPGHDGHILATSAILSAYGGLFSSQLRQAVFWLHLRQEIYAACSQQRPIRADLDGCVFESLDTSLDNDLWLHRALWICAQTLQWAYGGDLTPTKWRELCQLIEEWPRTRPSTFDALYFKPRDPSRSLWFPEATFATDEHGESMPKYARI